MPLPNEQHAVGPTAEGNREAAIEEYRQAIRLKPDLACRGARPESLSEIKVLGFVSPGSLGFPALPAALQGSFGPGKRCLS